MADVVRISGAYVRRGTSMLLSDIDLVLNTGERVALVGPNGVGKTTLLRIAAGELEPVVGHALPFDRAGEAHELLQSRRTTGKVVLRA